jgi:hypothetical protein
MHKQTRHNESIPAFLKEHDCGLLVCDFSPLRIGRTWRKDVSKSIGEVRLYEGHYRFMKQCYAC